MLHLCVVMFPALDCLREVQRIVQTLTRHPGWLRIAGYSTNAIEVWRYPLLTPVATLTGHTARVLFLATSPDGQSICTGAGVCPWLTLFKYPRCASCMPLAALETCQSDKPLMA